MSCFQFVLNQVIFGSLNYSATNADPYASDAFTINYDSWDGYQAERAKILDHFYEKDVKNAIFVTGDTCVAK